MRVQRFGILVASTLLVSACGTSASGPTGSATPTESSSSATPSMTATPTESPSSITPSPSTTSTNKSVALYFVGDTSQGLRLYREFRKVPIASGHSKGIASLQYLVAAGTKATDKDYTNLWGNGSTINSVTQSGSIATVDITIKNLIVGSASEMSAIDQLVWTLTANEKSVKKVRFTSQGKPLESFAGHVDSTGTFTRELSYEVLAPIWVTTTAKTLSNPVTITGTACTFEAGVAWTLKKAGKVEKSGSTTAAQACPVRSVWSVSLGTLKAGDYVFTAIDYSAKDGSVNQEDSKTFTVR